jgi:hypothetical protein
MEQRVRVHALGRGTPTALDAHPLLEPVDEAGRRSPSPAAAGVAADDAVALRRSVIRAAIDGTDRMPLRGATAGVPPTSSELEASISGLAAVSGVALALRAAASAADVATPRQPIALAGWRRVGGWGVSRRR